MHRLDAEGDDIWMEGVGSVHTGIFEPLDFNTSEVYVQSMAHGIDDCAFFSIDTDVFKSVPFEAEIIESGDSDLDLLFDEQYRPAISFNMEFIDDTLHIKGRFFGETRWTLKTLEAYVDNNEISLFIKEPTLNRIISGTPFRFEAKIPGFNAGIYTIKYTDILDPRRSGHTSHRFRQGLSAGLQLVP